MARLTFPIARVGLVVDVAINLKEVSLLPLRAVGAGPVPTVGEGLVDTGSDISAVSVSILQRLRLAPLQSTSTQSFAGSMPIDLYEVSLHVFDSRNVNLLWFSQPSLVVMEMPAGLPFAVILGMDVIRACNLHVDGPGSVFTLDF
ncbi:MAG: aspartyl protease family protein [Planctomycetia bacterium]|nr:aspartyl protease family protein [Planctomycetia bacterium]